MSKKYFEFDVDYIREQFPALSKTVNGKPAAFLDGPGGTQVPKRVVDQISDYLYMTNANHDGVFKTSVESDARYLKGKEAFADFFNCRSDEIIFGENTSSINFKISYAFARLFEPGDEIIITDIDHEGNRSPWRTLEDFGIVVNSVNINTSDITLDFEDFKSKLSNRTKLLAINWAANSCGTITDVKKFIAEAHKVGALTIVDAVHYAPHRYIDVKDIDTDILVCSSYKFFGPHYGIAYIRKELGDSLKSVRVMADDNFDMPVKFETGTPAMELTAGAAEAVEFIADVGRHHMSHFREETSELTGRRREIVAGMMAIDEYEERLAAQLREGLRAKKGVKVYGPKDGAERTSTVSFDIEGENSNDIAKFLAELGIFVWDGNYYALETITNVLKLESQGGLVRIGLAPYTIQDDIDRVLQAVDDYING